MRLPQHLAPARPRRRDPGQDGYALLVAVFSVILLSGLIAASSASSRARQGISEAVVVAPAHAREVALAGIAESLSWFRRQTVQPVTTFAPRLDPDALPPVNETADPDVGLVREYEITPGVWARYLVPRTGGPGEAVRDVSTQRGQVGAGSVWVIESHGALFRRPRADLPLGEGPNTRFATAAVATEIRRMTITPPAAAAICANVGNRVTIGNRARIRGGGSAGVAHRASTGSPVLEAGSEVEGSPSTTSVPDFAWGLAQVFGNDIVALKSMADAVVSDAAVLPPNLGEYTLTVIEGTAVFDKDRPLRGTGIVIVRGDCQIQAGSNSLFSGVLWVEDDLTIAGPCYLRGVCIAGDIIDVRGTGGDHAEIEYDGGILGELMTRMGSYRTSKATHPLRGEARIVTGAAP